jgi:hypothetical protein
LHLGTDIVGRAAQVRKVRPHDIHSAWQKRAIPQDGFKRRGN